MSLRHSVGIEHRRLAGFHDMLRPAHGRGRVHRHHLAGDEPVEQHPHGRELLLHARRPVVLLQLLHPGRHVERPDRRERQAAIFAPGEEPGARPGISPARVVVVDVGGEEFDVAPAGLLAEVGDERRHYIGVGRCRERAGRDDGGELVGHRSVSGAGKSVKVRQSRESCRNRESVDAPAVSGSGVNGRRERGGLPVPGDQPVVAAQFAEIATVGREHLGAVEMPDVPSVIGPELVAVAIAEILAAPGPEMGGHTLPYCHFPKSTAVAAVEI